MTDAPDLPDESLPPPDLPIARLSAMVASLRRQGARNYRKQAQKRAHILARARRTLAQRGAAAVTVRDLAQDCGVAVQTLYSLIGGREQILCAAVDELFGIQIAHARAHGAAAGDFILAYCDTVEAYVTRNEAYARAVVTLLRAHDHPIARITFARLETAFGAHLAALASDGALRPWVDAAALTRGICDAIGGQLVGWIEGRIARDALHRGLLLAVGLPLLGAAGPLLAARIEARLTGV